jgi:hypothetical protein
VEGFEEGDVRVIQEGAFFAEELAFFGGDADIG